MKVARTAIKKIRWKSSLTTEDVWYNIQKLWIWHNTWSRYTEVGWVTYFDLERFCRDPY